MADFLETRTYERSAEICRVGMYRTPLLRAGVEIGAQNFYPIGWCVTHQCHVWPIDEFIARMKASKIDVFAFEIARLRLINQRGKCEVMLPNGMAKNLAERIGLPDAA